MTAQTHDVVVFEGIPYNLVGFRGSALFDPRGYGLEFRGGASTACWRGFRCTYGLLEQNFVLQDLEINLISEDQTLLGHFPVPISSLNPPRYGTCGRFMYPDLKLRLAFSGSLTIGKDFIQELYVHMGFHPPYKWREVWELTLEDGRLLHAQDRSQAMAELRENLKNQKLQPDPEASREEIDAWIQQVFKIDRD